VFASAVGPLLLAETLRSTGSYNLIFNLLAVLTVLLGVGAWFVGLPVRHLVHKPDRIILSTGTA